MILFSSHKSATQASLDKAKTYKEGKDTHKGLGEKKVLGATYLILCQVNWSCFPSSQMYVMIYLDLGLGIISCNSD